MPRAEGCTRWKCHCKTAPAWTGGTCPLTSWEKLDKINERFDNVVRQRDAWMDLALTRGRKLEAVRDNLGLSDAEFEKIERGALADVSQETRDMIVRMRNARG